MPRSAPASVDAHPAFARALPFGLLIAGIAADGLIRSQALTLPWDLRWHYAARSVLAAAALLGYCRDLPEWREAGRPAPLGTPALLSLAIACGLGVFALWIVPALQAFAQSAGGIDLSRLAGHGAGALADSALTPLAGSGFTPLDAQGGIDWRLALPRLAGSALVVPLAEELFWRSLVMRWIDSPRFLDLPATAVSLRALLLQALLFGLEHDLWLAGILAGLAYGLLYRYSGRLWPAVLAHALTNGVLGIWVLATSNWTYW